jgi:hypothetical protein
VFHCLSPSKGKLNIEFSLPSFYILQNIYVTRAVHVWKICCVIQFQDPAFKWHKCRPHLRTSRGCLCATGGTELNSATVGMTPNNMAFRRICINITVGKYKGIPVAGRGDPYGCEMLRLPHFVDSRLTDGGEVVSLTRRPSFTPQEDSWYSFLLEAESTPGPQCGWKG